MNKRFLLCAGVMLAVCLCWVLTGAFADEQNLKSGDDGNKNVRRTTLKSFAEATREQEKEGQVSMLTDVGPPASGAPRGAGICPCECGGIDTVTMNVDPCTFNPATGARCPAPNQNAFVRVFPAGKFISAFTLQCVDLGLRFDNGAGAGPAYDTTLNIHIVPDAFDITLVGFPATGAPAFFTTITLPGDGSLNGTFIQVPVVPPLIILPTDRVIVEWLNPGGTATADMVPGNNQLGSVGCPTQGGISDPNCSFIWAGPGPGPGCGITEYQEMTGIGFPADLLFNLCGTFGSLDGCCCEADGTLSIMTFTDCTALPGARFDSTVTDPIACSADPFIPPCGTPPPSNDDCANALEVSHGVCLTFDTTVASDSGVPDATCGAIDKDVWYLYTVVNVFPPSTSGQLVVSTLGSRFDTVVAVYGPNVTCAALGVDIGCNDDISTQNTCSYIGTRADPLQGAIAAIPNVGAAPGDTFLIRVGGKFGGSGVGQINIDYVPTLGGNLWFEGSVGVCCFPNGDCEIVPSDGDCAAAGGFFSSNTNFFDYLDPDNGGTAAGGAESEFSQLGCKTFPCPGPGEACWNAIDLKPLLGGGTGLVTGTFTRLITEKLYYKYTLDFASGTTLTFDTCGSDFDTILQIFTTAGNGDCGTEIIVNDDCIFEDPDGTADGAREGASCFAPAGEDSSCLCAVVDGTPDFNSGVDSVIIICIGLANKDTTAVAPDIRERSIDPVPSCFGDPVTAVITVTDLGVGPLPGGNCFVCDVVCLDDSPDPARTFTEIEPDCADGVSNRTNDGCSISGAPPLADTQLAGFDLKDGPVYLCGKIGVYVDPLHGQRADEDWYELILTKRMSLTWRLLKAESIAEFFIIRQGDVDPCLTQSVGAVTTIDCTDTGSFLTIDACPGRYWLVVRPVVPNKPPCDTEYIMCIEGVNVPGPNCCQGDMNNDGEINGLDIQEYVDLYLWPPVNPNTDVLGPCDLSDFCRVDTNGDAVIDLVDVSLFAALLVNPDKPLCPVKALCEDPGKCQFPGASADGTAANTSDLNLDADFRVAECFCPTETGDITKVCWWGIYNDFGAGVDCSLPDPPGPAADDFTITFYNEDADPTVSCPTTIKAGPFTQAGFSLFSRADTGNLRGGNREFRYEVDLPTPVAVTAGECCWIEIVNRTTGTCFWLWSASAKGDGRAVQHVQDVAAVPPEVAGALPTVYVCPDDDITNDMAFCLDIRIADDGCDPPAEKGQCCYVDALGVVQCVLVTLDKCIVTYDGYVFAAGQDCTCPCPPPPCTVVCDPADIREAEGCGFDKNGGCNTTPTANPPPDVEVVPLVCNGSVTVCGDTFSTAAIRDTDWYEFTVPGPDAVITMTLETHGYDGAFLVLDTRDCNTNAVLFSAATGTDCAPVSGSQCLTGVAQYLVVITGSQTFTPHACGVNSAYRLTITCETPCPPPAPAPPNDPCAGMVELVDAVPQVVDNSGATAEAAIDPAGLSCRGFGPGGGSCPGTIGPDPKTVWYWFTATATEASITTCNSANQGVLDTVITVYDKRKDDCTLYDCALDEIGCSEDECPPLIFPDTLMSQVCVTGLTLGKTYVVLISPFDGGADTGPITVELNIPCLGGPAPAVCDPPTLTGQTPDLQGHGSGGTVGVRSDLRFPFATADDFQLVANGTFQNVEWWGFYINDATGGPCTPGDGDDPAGDSFTITYYSTATIGNFTLPGAVFASFQVTGNGVLTGRLIPAAAGNIPEVRYTATHPPLSVGTQCLWIEIVNNTNCFCSWFWQTAPAGNNYSATDDQDADGGAYDTDETNDFDLAFCLDVVLDPDSCLLLGACCDDLLVCTSPVFSTACVGVDETFFPGRDCATFNCPPPSTFAPPVDTCADAEGGLASISGTGSVSFTISGEGLTDTAPPTSTCEIASGGPFAHDANGWWLYTATNTTATFTMCGLDDTEDSVMTLFTDTSTCAALAERDCDDDVCTAPAFGTPEFAATGLVVGNTYLLVVDFYSGGHTDGPHQLIVTSP